MAGAVETTREDVARGGRRTIKTTRKGNTAVETERGKVNTGEIPIGKILGCRVRYFTDGAVIGSRNFVNEAFASARDRFGQKRKDGARRMRGAAASESGALWSLRDLKKGIE
jgi:hypothetical protein